ncbi:hypothetical protein D320_18412 [Haloferax sp. BAB-2207]|nr:hypothetical protein D320_18412 [Haloferax sp. BAB-2207]
MQTPASAVIMKFRFDAAAFRSEGTRDALTDIRTHTVALRTQIDTARSEVVRPARTALRGENVVLESG